ncbi:MAG: excinuclease ABC subunit UvrC [Candidatus Krumholzibacteriia bacterium]|nr:excinuclease ABC subunit UvrC [bacterium]MCB9515151.1 excinuclease ABC subunit UvrC [Candidatus Latescibacterota bacterium]
MNSSSDDSSPAPDALARKLERLPTSPGVYLFKDAKGKVIYVGKAKNLSSRVHSYFREGRPADPKTDLLVSKVADLDYLVLASEMEALVAENNFIKEYSPRYNIQLRDDKSYPYVRITLEEELPRIFLTRQMEEGGSLYLGPYTDVGAIRQTLRVLKSLFPIRDCPGDLPFDSLTRECLYYHIGRCKAPCTGRQSVAEYRDGVEKVRLYLTGKAARLRDLIDGEMRRAAEEQRYEQAARFRDQLQAIERLTHRQRTQTYGQEDRDALALARDREDCCGVVLRLRGGRLLASETYHFRAREAEADADVALAFFQQYYHRVQQPPPEVLLPALLPDGEDALLADWLSERRGGRVTLRRPQRGLGRELLALALENARTKLDESLATQGSKAGRVPPEVFELREALGLSALPRVIEGVDISNTGDREIVAALVSFRDGAPRKSGYRRFRIKGKDGQDDFAAVAEVVTRRFRRLKEEGAPFPDLLLIDGGPGQVGAAAEALRALAVEGQALIGLAKREEAIYRPGAPDAPVMLPQNSGALRLLQRVRDESHRFARGFHRERRGKRSIGSALDAVPGLGPARRRLLLDQFGSVQAVAGAALSELMALPGIGEALARRILATLASPPEEAP